MFQVLEGIVKVINPGGKTVVGVADGKGKFIWLANENVKACFPPKPYTNWQTTRFLLDLTYDIKWKDERNWEQYKGGYTSQNIIPLPTPIPAEFAIEPTLQPSGQDHPGINELEYVQNIKNPLMSQTVASTDNNEILNHILSSLRIISDNIYKMRILFEKFMKEPEMVTADTFIEDAEVIRADHVYSEDEVEERYGSNPNEDKLPEVF